MDNDILIDKFFEKDISPSEEDILFESLKTDRNLRQELHRSIMLERGMGRRMAALAPAASETAGIFGSLGIAPATGASFVAGNAAATYGMNSVIAGLSTLILGVLAILGLGFISGESAQMVFRGSKMVGQNSETLANDITYPVIEKELLIEPEYVSDSDKITGIKRSGRYKANLMSLNTPVNKNIASNSKDTSETMNPARQINIMNRKIGYSKSDYKENILSESVSFPRSNKASFPKPQNLFGPNDFDGISSTLDAKGANLLELRQFSGMGTLPDDFNAGETPILSNIGISYLMPVWNNFYIGVSYDRKVYYLEYEATTDEGLFNFRQNTLYSSIMGTAQWLPFGGEGKLNWFLRGSAGGTVLGPTGSAMTGFYLPITDDIKAIAAYEFQTIGYSLDNNGFGWAYDQGLQIGFSINLY